MGGGGKSRRSPASALDVPHPSSRSGSDDQLCLSRPSATAAHEHLHSAPMSSSASASRRTPQSHSSSGRPFSTAPSFLPDDFGILALGLERLRPRRPRASAFASASGVCIRVGLTSVRADLGILSQSFRTSLLPVPAPTSDVPSPRPLLQMPRLPLPPATWVAPGSSLASASRVGLTLPLTRRKKRRERHRGNKLQAEPPMAPSPCHLFSLLLFPPESPQF